MRLEQPLFTIATITYNSEEWVSNAIESILASSFTDFELLISDDCSTDDTWRVVQQYQDHKIRAWRNESNIGEYPNRNKVLNEARGKYILYVDGDDILYKSTLRNLSEYIEFFPNAQMIWGVQPANVDFAILPYLFDSKQLLGLIYGTNLPFSIIGFSETLFRIEELKTAGGLSEKYAIGDTFIKKKLALTCNALFVPMGFVFWRRSSNQASQKVNNDYQNFLEGFLIDCEIMKDYKGDEKHTLKNGIIGSFYRRLIKNTILKGKLSDFIRLYNLSRLKYYDILHVFQKYKFKYRVVDNIEKPLVNKFNFKKENE